MAGLITITGGKWTTYRKMAEDVIDHAELIGTLDHRLCATHELAVHGSTTETIGPEHFRVYGSDAVGIQSLISADPSLAGLIHPKLEFQKAEVIWHVRHEMARTVEDVLARRTRALLLDARTSIEAAPVVAGLMAAELKQDQNWIDDQINAYTYLATGYVLV